jgi:hypothetical protein
VKFTRYEIQAYTQMWPESEDKYPEPEPEYRWIPLPGLRPADPGTRRKIEKLRGTDGRFESLADARSVYSLVMADRPYAMLRLRKVVIQEVYATIDGISDLEDPLLARAKVVSSRS